jgi:site-specific DNA-methyltransferase (adenine-specific)
LRDRHHPTQKPLELLKYLIETYTQKGDLILDFTSGSFTTCVGAEQLNRRSIGIELEKKYCDVGVKRLSQLQMRLDI